MVVLDCADSQRLADFWMAALSPLGYRREGSFGPYVELVPAGSENPPLLLQEVPEGKPGKNRMHLDLSVTDLDSEVRRLTELGARTLTADLSEGDYRWAVMADPEDNEFCIVVEPSASPDTRPSGR